MTKKLTTQEKVMLALLDGHTLRDADGEYLKLIDGALKYNGHGPNAPVSEWHSTWTILTSPYEIVEPEKEYLKHINELADANEVRFENPLEGNHTYIFRERQDGWNFDSLSYIQTALSAGWPVEIVERKAK